MFGRESLILRRPAVLRQKKWKNVGYYEREDKPFRLLIERNGIVLI